MKVQPFDINSTIDWLVNDNHFFFLDKDSLQYIQTILDTRPKKTRGVIFLLIVNHTEDIFESLESTKLQLNDDIYMIVGKNVYELYKIIPNGHLMVNDLGTLIDERIVRGKWRRRKDLQGLHFTTATLEEFPYCIDLVLDESTGNFKDWKGICLDMLESFSQELNFTYTLRPPTDGTWNGILKDLKAGTIQMAASSLIHSLLRDHDFDWTMPFANGFERMFIKRPTLAMNYLAYFQPFKLGCWLVFMLLLLTIPFLLMFVWRKGSEPEHLGPVSVLSSVGLSVLNYGNDLHPRKTSTRIILISFVIGTFLLMKHWEAILISFLAKQTVALPFNNLREFYENTNDRLMIMPGGMIENDFRYSNDTLWQKVFHERIEPHLEEVKAYPDFITDMFHFIEKDYHTAIYDAYDAWSGEQAFLDCEIVAVPTKYFPRPRSWAFKKDSPYTQLFDFYVRQFIEKGHYKALEAKYQESQQRCQDIGTLPIDFRICVSAFLVLIFGLALSFVSFLGEFVMTQIHLL